MKTTIAPGIDILYGRDDNALRRKLGKRYQPPAQFQHGTEVLVARLEGEGDGRAVEIYECRMPACFYMIKIPAANSHLDGHIKPAMVLGTGSSMDELTADIALAISTGMLDVEPA